MIHTAKYKRTIVKEEVIGVDCDFCEQKEESLLGFSGTVFTISFSYGSAFDGNKFEFVICDKCFDKQFLNKLIQDND